MATPFRADNWGVRARFGIFIVGNEAVPEAEWWAMAPPGVSVHAARVTAKAPWAAWDESRRDVALTADLERGAAQFAGLRVDVAVVGHTSSSVLGGAGWDDAVAARLAPLLGGGKATTNGADCAHALRAVGGARPFLVLPPWFDDGFVRTAAGYMAGQGLAPAGTLLHRPDPKFDGVPPGEMTKRFMHVEQRIDLLFDQIVAACPDAADSVLIGGTGFRCVGIIEALEARLGRPVVTANQASLWRCLRLAGVDAKITGYGRLLAG